MKIFKSLTTAEENIPSKFIFRGESPSQNYESPASLQETLETKSEYPRDLNKIEQEKSNKKLKRMLNEFTYESIVSKNMDMPDLDFDKISSIPRTNFVEAINKAKEKGLSGYLRYSILRDTLLETIGLFDTSDLSKWFEAPEGQEFLNGNYKNLRNYVNKKSEEAYIARKNWEKRTGHTAQKRNRR